MPAEALETVHAFPRSIDRGLIEARTKEHLPVKFSEISAINDRGLIEALDIARTLNTTQPHFRDQLIAASLKPDGKSEAAA